MPTESDAEIGTGVKKRIFIVYANHDAELADALEQLFEHWGFHAFYCRQEHREQAVSKPYRDDLRDELKKADLAVLLLSRSFKDSRYCQVEAGAMTALGTPYILVMIPPATKGEIVELSPILEGLEILDARKDANPRRDFVSLLRTRLSDKFGGQRGIRDDKVAVKAVEDSLAAIVDLYRLEPPRQAHIGVWPSLESDSPAPLSIIENIGRSLLGGVGRAELVFVGISLKFSLKLITKALEVLPKKERGKTSKRDLTIDLVHMDDQSHILHALKDTTDITNVLENFHAEWPRTQLRWHSACAAAGINLIVKTTTVDYIPPRVGILIDGHGGPKLYAGRCSFSEIGGVFQLKVGEREYFFYTAADERGKNAIRDFKGYLSLYKRPGHNGVVLPSRALWVAQLEACIENYQDISEVTLISRTMTKLQPLIIPSLRKGLLVKVYIHHPDLLPADERYDVTSLARRIRDDIRNDSYECSGGRVEIRRYRHDSSFRAALVGHHVLGIQMYVHRVQWANFHEGLTTSQSNTDSKSLIPPRGEMMPSELRLVVTRHSSQFESLRKGLIEQFLRCEGVDGHPIETIAI